MAQLPESLKILQHCEGHRFAQWLGDVLPLDPELERAVKTLAGLLQAGNSLEYQDCKKIIVSYIGYVKCPSPGSCQKLAYRTHIVKGWLQDTANPLNNRLHTGLYALERLLPACEGAEDRHAVFKPAVLQLIATWLALLTQDAVDLTLKTHMLYQTMLLDQCSQVETRWWFDALASADIPLAVSLAEQTIENLTELEPARHIVWKSYTQRWLRMRLKAFLEFIDQPRLLAELLKRSAIDATEAAQAVQILHKTGQSRVALRYGERWLRIMPDGTELVQSMLDVYLSDGWDEEARQLARAQYERDAHPRWQAYL